MDRALLALCLAATVAAQNHLTVPPEADSRDGTGNGRIVGFELPGRQQILLGGSLIAGLTGRPLRAITFRRDGFEKARRAGSADLTMAVSLSPLADVRDASPRFRGNSGASAIQLFTGRIDLPASPRLANRDAAQWNGSDTVTVPFAQRWVYPGGNLCIEITGTPVAGARTDFWSVDAESDGVLGRRTILGAGCGPIARRARPPASVDPYQLRPGATPRFVAAGEAGTVAALLLAGRTLATPVDLGFLGAPGCELWLQPEVSAPAAVGAAHGGRPGSARIDVHLARQPAYLGASFAAQWMHLGGMSLTTSNALHVQLAGSTAAIAAAMVTAAPAAVSAGFGQVRTSLAPVVRLHW